MEKLVFAMIQHFKGDPRRISHFLKVHAFAKQIAEMEAVSAELLEIIEVASYVHDIGIKEAERIHGRNDGKMQEKYGPEPARNMLSELGYRDEVIGRVVYLIAHHHTYQNIDGMDYQILVEADFIVNLQEDNAKIATMHHVYDKIFMTKSGKILFKEIFEIDTI
ncbi:MAG: HD domain-containing protein [Lachnospiraceae bacterium]